jgi:hypothetical protein
MRTWSEMVVAKQQTDITEQWKHVETQIKEAVKEDLSRRTLLWEQRERMYQEELRETKHLHQKTETELEHLKRQFEGLQQHHQSEMQEKERKMTSLEHEEK